MNQTGPRGQIINPAAAVLQTWIKVSNDGLKKLVFRMKRYTILIIILFLLPFHQNFNVRNGPHWP